MPCFGKGIAGMMRPLMICLVFFLGFLAWTPMAVTQDRSAPVKEITVAVGQDYAPFYFRDHEGRADGWLVDIWRLWSRKSGSHFDPDVVDAFLKIQETFNRISEELSDGE